MVTYVKGENLPDGSITTTVLEQVWYDGKPRTKRCFTTVSGDSKVRKENKVKKKEKETQKAKDSMQSKLDSFSQVEVIKEGF